jgi:hypothetical protein
MLLLTLLAVARVAWSYRPSVLHVDRSAALRFVRLVTAAGVFATALLSPVLSAMGVRIADGRWEWERIFWRSSPTGVDLVAFVLPNPNHPLTPDAVRAWLTPRPDAYYENVASLTFVALATILVAWRAGWRIPRLWSGLALVFGALALGPFLHVAGINTLVPGPWAFLRRASRRPGPDARAIHRGVDAGNLGAVCGRAMLARPPVADERRRMIVAVVAALLVFELPRAATALFSRGAGRLSPCRRRAGRRARVELPFGIRDGTSSVGNFTARSQLSRRRMKRLIGAICRACPSGGFARRAATPCLRRSSG